MAKVYKYLGYQHTKEPIMISTFIDQKHFS